MSSHRLRQALKHMQTKKKHTQPLFVANFFGMSNEFKTSISWIISSVRLSGSRNFGFEESFSESDMVTVFEFLFSELLSDVSGCASAASQFQLIANKYINVLIFF